MDKLWMGAELRRIRTLAGVSLDEAAEAAGVTAGMISQYEKGRAMPPPGKLARLARCYRMAPEELAAYIDYPLSGAVTRSLRQWYETLHDYMATNGHSDAPDADSATPDEAAASHGEVILRRRPALATAAA